MTHILDDVQDFSTVNEGLYVVKAIVDDNNGCVSEDQIMINVIDGCVLTEKLSLELVGSSSGVICADKNLDLNVTAVNGTAPYKYVWNELDEYTDSVNCTTSAKRGINKVYIFGYI